MPPNLMKLAADWGRNIKYHISFLILKRKMVTKGRLNYPLYMGYTDKTIVAAYIVKEIALHSEIIELHSEMTELHGKMTELHGKIKVLTIQLFGIGLNIITHAVIKCIIYLLK